ncbi:peptide chain release factor N(5)-glutamine methyltransferase [Lactobacillus sp. S2-2]|uniref:peptide chain release factor N(5)-glutamine methyltransferase n=1 Tax=Lactobacillus sp. S2-2 TaxID=2692917 RepID=UPI001EFFB3B2|nr:peptide chain release factor N(5)-glutamine methyltransferase [Lactobacillus sp. S2-2]MCF6515760.1 peptide chain release factor N(5)-glutamine methyltransferase [Lactobacillus sp. S2-2]
MNQKCNSEIIFSYLKKWEEKISNVDLNPEVASMFILNYFHWSQAQLLSHYRDTLDGNDLNKLNEQLTRYINGEPAQYIIKKAYFYGNELFVNPKVLIPRPETEELVDLILKEHQEDSLKILDIGTGSGAIAISLKKERPNWEVFAADISSDSLEIAQLNADEIVDSKINFFKSDVFESINIYDFDLIVSNPPYISFDEIDLMDKSVMQYEPHLALFAENNGLYIYDKILKRSSNYLKSDGEIYFEIGFNQAKSLKHLANQYLTNSRVDVFQDINGTDRIVHIKLERSN